MIHRRLAASAFALAALFACAANARMKEVAPGAEVQLAPGEGLLVVAVEAHSGFDHLRIKRDGALFEGGTIKEVAEGVTTRLFVADAGRYRFDEVRIGGLRYDLGENPEYGFEVAAGVINYPGHLRFEPTDWYAATFHVANHALLAIDWLEQHQSALESRFAFSYSGHYPDAFPAFYREARGDRRGKVVPRSAPVPSSGVLALTVDALWQEASVQAADLNDRGDLLALSLRNDSTDTPQWRIEIVDLAAGTAQPVMAWAAPIEDLQWAGDRTLVVTGSSQYAFGVAVVHAQAGPPSKPWKFETLRIPRAGEVVATLPGDPGSLLFASSKWRDGRSELRVHRIDVSSQKALDDSSFRDRDAIDRGVPNDLAWFADGRGRLRAALVRQDEKLVVMHGAGREFKPAMTIDGDTKARLMGLSADGEIIYAFTDEGRAQRDLVEIDPATGKVGRTLFSRPGVDVQRVLFDHRHELIGASYFEAGHLVSHFFDAASERLYRKVQASFPGRIVRLLDRDAAGENYLLVVAASDKPGELFHYDVKANRASLIEDFSPWLDDSRLVASKVVKARSQDGFDIEAYLTLPREPKGKVPLVLYPHGGPVGVRDSRHFSPEVQFLAGLGYAVLQVNFRGSEGFGTDFREAAKGNYGTRIEDDIDAALQAALAQHPLDATRMCVLGASYGGYSALVSAIRWPDRFRCAVSMSGVSDLALFFTASDGGRHAEGRKALERHIGDPRKNAAEMRENSPLYRYAALHTPVMLVHGTEDLRVDFEHTRRMQRMLNLAGIEPVVVSLPGEGHGIEDPKNRRLAWHGVAGFLRRYLGDPLAAGDGGARPGK